MSRSYDVLVLGAGSGGMAAAKRAASKGADVGVVENRTVGGTCVARGCMPKKFLVIAARRMREIQAQGPSGLHSEPTEVNWADIIDHEQAIVDDLIDANRDGLVDRDGIELIEGEAVIQAPDRVEVGDTIYETDSIILATGLQPDRPPIDGVEYGMDSAEFLRNRTLPYSMAIVGGGYISVEFASIVNRFGVDVTIFQRPDQLIDNQDRHIAAALAEHFEERGITVRTGSEVQSIEKVDRSYVVEFESDGSMDKFGADRVLIATGRRPNTDEIGLENTDVETERGFPAVDEFMQTSAPDIYAVGDITGHKQFTPVAIAEGKVAGENAVTNNDTRINYEAIPSAVFTDPEIGSVGLTQSEAEQKYDAIQTAMKSFRPFSSAVHREPGEARIKLIYEGDGAQLVGLHVMGPHASEMVQGFAPAMRKGLAQDDLKDFPGIHPTIAEEIFSTKPG